MTLQEQYEKQKEINKELVDEIKEFKETNHELAELAIKRQKEIDELEKCRQILSDCTDRQRKETKELEEELKNWKDKWKEQVQKAIYAGDARTQQTIQLTKAKKLLKQWLQTTYASGCDNVNLGIETEQFLKEIEK